MSFFEQFVNKETIKPVTEKVEVQTLNKPVEIRRLTSTEYYNVMGKYKGEKNTMLENINQTADLVLAAMTFPLMNKTDTMEAAKAIHESRTGEKIEILTPRAALFAMFTTEEINDIGMAVIELQLGEKAEELLEQQREFRS